MIKRLNNKGLTAIEVLICFSIVIVIVMSMFKIVSNQKDKQTIESYKNSVIAYKNAAMKTIEDDIRKGGGINEVLWIIEDDTDSEGYNRSTVEFKVKGKYESYAYERALIIYKKNECNDDIDCGDYIFYRINKNAGTPDVYRFKIPKITYLRLNKADISQKNGYLSIYVGFNHPDLGNKYTALDIVEPIISENNAFK